MTQIDENIETNESPTHEGTDRRAMLRKMAIGGAGAAVAVMVQVHHNEGVAIHTGPKSCVGGRVAASETLTEECVAAIKTASS